MLSTRTGGSNPSLATINANAFRAAAFSIAAIRIVLGLGSQVQLLHLGGPESVDCLLNEEPADNSPSGERDLHGCRQVDQGAF